MSADFDPYHEWLGIPAVEQPPNHYRLLGVPQFENNANVVSNAADRQMTFLRTFQIGKHSAESQKLLNHVAAARSCLLNPQKKAEYDAQLRVAETRQRQSTNPPLSSAARESPFNALPLTPAAPIIREVSRSVPTLQPRRQGIPVAIIGGGTLVVMTLILGVFLFSGPKSAAPKLATTAVPKNADHSRASGRQTRAGSSVAPSATMSRLQPRFTASNSGDAPSGAQPSDEATSHEMDTSVVVDGDWLPLANGELVTGGGPAMPVEQRFLFGGASWTDYDVSVEVFEQLGVEPARPGFASASRMETHVLVRASNSGDDYWDVDVGAADDARKFEAVPHIARQVAAAASVIDSLPDRIGAWYPVTVRVRGAQLRVLISDREVLSASDSRLTRGKVGLRTVGVGRARWRNLVVRNPEGEVLWKDWPARPFVVPATGSTFPLAQGSTQQRTINAKSDWQGDVAVPKGAKVTVQAEGTWLWGETTSAAGVILEHYPPVGYLEGRLSGWPLRIGKSLTFFASEAGPLQFRVFDPNRADNGGELQVRVTVEPPAPAVAALPIAERIAAVDPLGRVRRPLPAKPSLSEAVQRVDKRYAQAFADAKTADAEMVVVRQLWRDADGMRDDPASLYAALDAARRRAAEAANVADSTTAIERLSDEFSIDPWPVAVETFQLAADSAKSDAARIALASMVPSYVSQALAEGRRDAALAFVVIGVKAATETRDRETTRRMQRLRVQTTSWLGLKDAADAARKTLESSPDDAPANRTLGVWLCLVEDDWDAGRALVAKSSNDRLLGLLDRERPAPADGAATMNLADDWLELTASAPHDEQPYVRLRARRWYEAASAQLAGQAAEQCNSKLNGASVDPPLQIRRQYRNSAGMVFIWCPPGDFRLGSPPGEPLRASGVDVERLRRVRLTRGFWLAKYETTQAVYRAVVGVNSSRYSTTAQGADAAVDGDQRPVETVAYAEAYDFCRTLSFAERRTYRMPTEAEWEYACRAGTTTPFSFGSSCNGVEANVNGHAPYNAERGPNLNRTTVVGVYPANAWGFHDMHGNVWEWCQDLYGTTEPPPGVAIDPQGGTKFPERMHRGGCSEGFCEAARSANRPHINSGWRAYNMGFRVLLEPAEATPPTL